MEECCGKSFCTLKICCCDWFNKQTNWPIAKQDKVKQECQTENEGMRKGRIRGLACQVENELDTQNGIEVKAMSLGAAHRLIEMG